MEGNAGEVSLRVGVTRRLADESSFGSRPVVVVAPLGAAEFPAERLATQ